MNALVIASVEQESHSKSWDPYQILGIKRRSSPKQIRAAYRSAAKKLHSDAGGDARAFLRLKEAHDFLMDTVARALWDRKQIRAAEQECKLARSMLESICSVVINRIADGGSLPPENANIPDLMRQVICAQLDDFAASQNTAKNRLRRLKLMVGKTKRKGVNENIVARVLGGKIAEVEVGLETLAKQIRVTDIMLAELEVYEPELPKSDEWKGNLSPNSSFSTMTMRVFF